MVALKHKARLLLHWHHICFGLAYMAGTPQRYNAWIMFRSLTACRLDGESSSLRRTQCWAERLFVLHSPVTFLFSSGLELFIFLPFVGGWCSATTQRGSCSQGIMLDSSEAVFLSWSWPRNALILFYYHNTSNPPPAYCICTLIPAIFIHTARLLIKASVNGTGTWKKSGNSKGASSIWMYNWLFNDISCSIFLVLCIAKHNQITNPPQLQPFI